jgi:hypothetical protein
LGKAQLLPSLADRFAESFFDFLHNRQHAHLQTICLQTKYIQTIVYNIVDGCWLLILISKEHCHGQRRKPAQADWDPSQGQAEGSRAEEVEPKVNDRWKVARRLAQPHGH